MISVIVFTCKMGKHSDFELSFFRIEVAWRDFTVVTKLLKNSKSLYGFGGRSLKIRDVYMDLEPYFKVHNLVSVHSKSIILGQMTNEEMESDMDKKVFAPKLGFFKFVFPLRGHSKLRSGKETWKQSEDKLLAWALIL